jgi:hypothetical protein
MVQNIAVLYEEFDDGVCIGTDLRGDCKRPAIGTLTTEEGHNKHAPNQGTRPTLQKAELLGISEVWTEQRINASLSLFQAVVKSRTFLTHQLDIADIFDAKIGCDQGVHRIESLSIDEKTHESMHGCLS